MNKRTMKGVVVVVIMFYSIGHNTEFTNVFKITDISENKTRQNALRSVDVALPKIINTTKIKNMHEDSKKHNTPTDANNVLAEGFFYLDLADTGYWLICSKDGKRYTAGDDKQKVQDLIKRLNEAHRPNIHQGDMHEIFVCWNEHEKGEKCDYVQEL